VTLDELQAMLDHLDDETARQTANEFWDVWSPRLNDKIKTLLAIAVGAHRQRSLPPELDEVIDVARGYIQYIGDDPLDEFEAHADDFAVALVALADACVIGLPCDRHGGEVHGKEAEELRAGVERSLSNTSEVLPEDAADVLAGLRKSLIFLLDRIDARDSIAFREATSPPDEVAALLGSIAERRLP
jgi:hypothetical protein